jgi:predicted metal-dependent TIM-barrel fold hydrolase
MEQSYPSLRPLGQFREGIRGEEVGFSHNYTPKTGIIPWIDPHGHHHSLTWRELEKFDLTGCLGVVMATGNIGDQSPYRPISIEDIQTQWDQIIRKSHAISRSNSFNAYAAIGIHTTLGPVDDIDSLINRMSEYATLDEVVALSETGITMVQEHETLPLADQRQRVRKQLQVAGETGLPAILHTPTTLKKDPEYTSISLEAHDTGDIVIDSETPKLDAAKIDIELANEVGFPEDQLVLTHADRSVAPWVLENTDCYVSFTLGNATRNVSSKDIRNVINEYSSDRIMIDTDCASHKEFETFAVRRAIIDLLRMGINQEDVRKVVYENQCKVLGLNRLDS